MILPPGRRGDLTNQQWERLKPLLPAQKPKVGRPSNDHRTILNGIKGSAVKSSWVVLQK